MNVFGWSALLVVAVAAGDPVADGLRFYREGKYAEAVAAFREALDADPENPRLNYNLALALWRNGDADGAETAAEKAAALGSERFEGLRDGILGGLRFEQAESIADAPAEPGKEVAQLTKAVELAGTARRHFQHGAAKLLGASPESGAEVLRNLERAIQLETELKKRLEEAKKKQEEQKKDDDKKDDDKKDDDKKDDDKKDEKKQDDKKDQEKPDDESKDDKNRDDKNKDDKNKDDKNKDDKNKDPKKGEEDQPPEPDPKSKQDEEKPKSPDPKEKDGDKEKPKPEDDEQEEKPHAAQPSQEVPGEADPTKVLTPEQRREILKKLAEFEQHLQERKAARKAARPKVKKDW